MPCVGYKQTGLYHKFDPWSQTPILKCNTIHRIPLLERNSSHNLFSFVICSTSCHVLTGSKPVLISSAEHSISFEQSWNPVDEEKFNKTLFSTADRK